MRALLLAFGLVALANAAGAAELPGGAPLTRAFAEDLLRAALDDGAAAGPARIVIEAPALPLGNQAAAATQVAIDQLAVEADSGRFTGMLVGMVGTEPRFRLPLKGRVQKLVELPVLARPVAAGEQIGAEDIEWVAADPGRLPASTLTDPAQLVGFEARRRLQPGRFLTSRDLGPPLLVRRGRPVRLFYLHEGMTLSATGTAEDDGAYGEPVRIVNAGSRQQIEGIVSGPDQVSLGGIGEPALAGN
jgi:flagella basal body P-ring formation protein FlgA